MKRKSYAGKKARVLSRRGKVAARSVRRAAKTSRAGRAVAKRGHASARGVARRATARVAKIKHRGPATFAV
ncbi:hypothetical protein HZA38_06405 [Candidatus Peregrinibacteria bacterium]|nr:hypothetical protein [Candidatus Peregrinibacteria bacterium]